MVPGVMKPGEILFTDRNYKITEVPDSLAGLTFLRTTIDDFDFEVEAGGELYALTPPENEKGAASQETRLRKLGFERTDDPIFQLFPGSINRVCVYRKTVKKGERFHFSKVVLPVAGKGVRLK